MTVGVFGKEVIVLQPDRLPQLLLPWYDRNRRDLPWRQDRQPYHIWLSEVMLQQTRVEAVKGYYARFLETLPDIESLANAPEDLCHKLWEGLGYYARVRNLQKGARQIMEHYGGVFPGEYDKIRAICGVGEYTAGAIGSICFELPTPAVDGNVIRVMTRLLADDRPSDSLHLRREITRLLQAVYPPGHCGDFTQALMELGATVCIPNGAPRCETCPLAELCAAGAQGCPEKFPVRPAKKPRRQEEFTVFLLRCGDRIALNRRGEEGLLAGLWEYPNVSGSLPVEEALAQAGAWGVKPVSPVKIVEKSHIFTHVQWKLHGVYITCASMPDRFTWVTGEEMEDAYALPTAFRQFEP